MIDGRDVLAGRAEYAIVRGDALASLRGLPDKCIQCVCCSPPYYGLRDYGLPPSIWGGRLECEHSWGADTEIKHNKSGGDGKQYTNVGSNLVVGRSAFCVHCSAWRGCLGLEPNPGMFIAHLVELFREVRRVLRDDGTCWVNLGDSYAGSGKGPSNSLQRPCSSINNRQLAAGAAPTSWIPIGEGFKSKDLMLMPARFAIAMQDDGWYVRSAIVWNKLSCMPESCVDRPTSAHEMIYLFAKQSRYFYDSSAVRQPYDAKTVERNVYPVKNTGPRNGQHRPDYSDGRSKDETYTALNPMGASLRNVWTLGPDASSSNWDYCDSCHRLFVGTERIAIKTRDGQRVCPCGASDAFVAHYATFPSEIPRRAIKAGTSARGVCANCGAGWRRVVERGKLVHTGASGNVRPSLGKDVLADPVKVRSGGMTANGFIPGHSYVTQHIGWQPGCTCDAGEPIGALVLDPFSGSGTSGRVARQLGRRYIGLELSDRYANASEALLAREDRPLFDELPIRTEQLPMEGVI